MACGKRVGEGRAGGRRRKSQSQQQRSEAGRTAGRANCRKGGGRMRQHRHARLPQSMHIHSALGANVRRCPEVMRSGAAARSCRPPHFHTASSPLRWAPLGCGTAAWSGRNALPRRGCAGPASFPRAVHSLPPRETVFGSSKQSLRGRRGGRGSDTGGRPDRCCGPWTSRCAAEGMGETPGAGVVYCTNNGALALRCAGGSLCMRRRWGASALHQVTRRVRAVQSHPLVSPSMARTGQ